MPTYKSLAFLGFPKYRVGDDGSVWKKYKVKCTHCHSVLRFVWRRCILKPIGGKAKINYQRVGLHHKGNSRWYLVHRLVLEAFVGPCPEGMEARHYPDRDPKNNRLLNLSWATKKQNAKDKIVQGSSLKGRANKKNSGSRNGGAVLTDKQVRWARRRYVPKKFTYRMIADKLGVSEWTIMGAVQGKTYQNVV